MGQCCPTNDSQGRSQVVNQIIECEVPASDHTLRCYCYCGACNVEVSGEPAMQVFCHCDDCRRWGGGIAQAAKLYPADKVKVSGDLLSLPYQDGSMSWRKSCAKCGGAVVDDKSQTPFKMMMVPAGLFDTTFKPTMHIHYAWKVFSLKDDLPKYRALPKAMGAPEEDLVDDSIAPHPKMQEEESQRNPGSDMVSCYCGACTLTIDGIPSMQVCCHCDDCRRWGGAIFQAAKLYPADKVTMEGNFLSKQEAYAPGMNSWRQCCSKCGGVVYDDKSHNRNMIMIPAGLFSTPFSPSLHIRYAQKVYSVKDGLPKYAKLPKAMGAAEEELLPE